MVPVTENSSKLLKDNVFYMFNPKQGHRELSRESYDGGK
jgi:hypothetical protein